MKYGMLTAFVIGVVIGIFLLANLSENIEQTVITEKKWKLIPLREQDLPPGETGLERIYIMPHDPDASTYNSNITSGWYEYLDAYSGEMIGETPYNTPFDIVYKVRVNRTHGYNETSGEWEPDWFYLHHRSVDLGFPDFVNCTEVIFATSSDYAWVHYYNNNTGNGFTISKGETVEVDEYEFWAYV